MLGLQHDVHRKNFGTSNLGFGDLDRYSGEIVKFFKFSLVQVCSDVVSWSWYFLRLFQVCTNTATPMCS